MVPPYAKASDGHSEPMFFFGFFCGFERCGSAAFPNFRGGIFPEKCVRTNSRILHQDRYIIHTAGIFPRGGYRRVEGVGPAGDFSSRIQTQARRFFEVSTYASPSQTVVGNALGVWILDSVAGNRNHPRMHLLPRLSIQKKWAPYAANAIRSPKAKDKVSRIKEVRDSKSEVQLARRAAGSRLLQPSSSQLPPQNHLPSLQHRQRTHR